MAHAKPHARARARELRLQGWTYDRIQTELGCSRSSVSLWVRDLPRPERPKRTREESSALARKGWEPRLRLREEERRRQKEEARKSIGGITDRDLFIAGVSLYWAEGTKDKPYARREKVIFVNSDPGMIRLFLHWLETLEVERERLRFTVMIHETADVPAAEEYWADLVGDPDRSRFTRTAIKRHNPRTLRKNVGDSYRGCLTVKVLRSADLYRRIEGAWYGIVESAREADHQNRT